VITFVGDNLGAAILVGDNSSVVAYNGEDYYNYNIPT